VKIFRQKQNIFAKFLYRRSDLATALGFFERNPKIPQKIKEKVVKSP